MARLTIALALVACSHAFQGPLAPRAPAHKAPAVAQPHGARNWLTKLRAAVADPAPVAAETKQDRLAEYVAAKGGTRVIRRVRRAASANLRRRARYERRERCAKPKPLQKQIAPITHPRTQVLIANNGMAATKSIMSMRRWAYLELGDERALEFIVMARRGVLLHFRAARDPHRHALAPTSRRRRGGRRDDSAAPSCRS